MNILSLNILFYPQSEWNETKSTKFNGNKGYALVCLHISHLCVVTVYYISMNCKSPAFLHSDF